MLIKPVWRYIKLHATASNTSNTHIHGLRTTDRFKDNII